MEANLPHADTSTHNGHLQEEDLEEEPKDYGGHGVHHGSTAVCHFPPDWEFRVNGVTGGLSNNG